MIIQWAQKAAAQFQLYVGPVWNFATGDGGAVIEPEPEVVPTGRATTRAGEFVGVTRQGAFSRSTRKGTFSRSTRKGTFT